MKKILLLLSVAFFCSNSSFATHIMGGEITWECDTAGSYIFNVKLYRDCSGVNLTPRGGLTVHNYPNVGMKTSVPLTIINSYEITPQCNGTVTYSCANGDSEASFFYHLRTAPFALNGLPPVQGWILTFDDVARNNTDNLQGSAGITLRSKIFNYPGRDTTCMEQSPEFLEHPIGVHPTNLEFQYHPNAVDIDSDSIAFDWAQPLTSIGSANFITNVSPAIIPFQIGFSYTSPFPGAAQNPNNVSAVLDRSNGSVKLTPASTGKYVSVLKVSSYNCGSLVSEIYRDFQFQFVLGAANNNKPLIRAPFQVASSNFTKWADTVFAGELVNFTIQSVDFPSVGTFPPVFDTVTLFATGHQFGSNYTNAASGCLNPPCATLNTTLPQSNSPGQNVTFSWQTANNHVIQFDSCINKSTTYNFVFRAKDDVCPVPAQRVEMVSITVLDTTTAIAVSAPSINQMDRVRLFPNPTKDNLQIEGLLRNEEYVVEVRNVRGQLVQNQHIQNSESFKIELNQPSGIYFIQLTNEKGERANLKVVKQ